MTYGENRLLRQDYPEDYDDAYTRQTRFRSLALACTRGNGDAMWQMGRYFDGLYEAQSHVFFPLCAAFWKYMAFRAGSAEAARWLEQWEKDNGMARIPAAMEESRTGWGVDGKRYRDLGYLYFRPGIIYNVCPADSCGVVPVCIHPSDGHTFEDGLSKLTYYDEFLRPLPAGTVYYHPDWATKKVCRIHQPRLRRRAMVKTLQRRPAREKQQKGS